MTGRFSAATERALDRISKDKITAYRAAKLEGISLPTIYRALRKIRERKSIEEKPMVAKAKKATGR